MKSGTVILCKKVNTEIKSILRDMLNRKEVDKKDSGLPFDKMASTRQNLFIAQNIQADIKCSRTTSYSK